MPRVSMFVPGVMGKPRPRFSGHAYPDKRWTAYKAQIQRAWLKRAGGKLRASKPSEVAVALRIVTRLPKSVKETRPAIVKPDADNVAKAILDGLAPDGSALFVGAWDDDCQVTRLLVEKAPQASHDAIEGVYVTVEWRED